jgi:hypothetical protein
MSFAWYPATVQCPKLWGNWVFGRNDTEGTCRMNDDDLDRSYSALCASLACVGEEKAQLFLSMMCLSLMARYERAEDVLPLIANVQAQCAAEASGSV